jgi:hypothetical protein
MAAAYDEISSNIGWPGIGRPKGVSL